MIKPTILILLLISSTGTAFGYDYYDDKVNAVWDHVPKVCFNVPKEQKYYSIRAIDSWRKNWTNHVGNDEFHYKISDLSKNLQQYCDINIVNGSPAVLGASSNALGVTQCSFKENEFADKCLIVMPFSDSDYYNTLVHELGHAFGLGHRYPYKIEGMLGVLQANDIMFFKANPFHHITIESLDGLVYYYGEDGFKNPEKVFIPRVYNVTHAK